MRGDQDLSRVSSLVSRAIAISRAGACSARPLVSFGVDDSPAFRDSSPAMASIPSATSVTNSMMVSSVRIRSLIFTLEVQAGWCMLGAFTPTRRARACHERHARCQQIRSSSSGTGGFADSPTCHQRLQPLQFLLCGHALVSPCRRYVEVDGTWFLLEFNVTIAPPRGTDLVLSSSSVPGSSDASGPRLVVSPTGSGIPWW